MSSFFFFFFFRISRKASNCSLNSRRNNPSFKCAIVAVLTNDEDSLCWAQVLCPIRFKPQNLLIQLNKKKVQILEAPKIKGNMINQNKLDVKIVISIPPPPPPMPFDA